MGSAADYQARLREHLAARLPRRRRDETEFGVGDDAVVGLAFADPPDEHGDLQRARDFQRELFDAGLAWPTGPVELGGGGLTPAEAAVATATLAEFELPNLHFFHVGQQIVAPAIEMFGTNEQQQRWLVPLWRGDALGCQLFSEPDAGSDLAAVRTRAVKVDGGWIVNGQKVWSSGAHHADVGELLARTHDDPALRHKGLSMFLIDMRSPGVTVTPLRQMTGNAHFCEVFLDDVFVPDEALLGELGQGWTVALTSLNSERDDSAGLEDSLFKQPLRRYVQLAVATGASADPIERQRIAQQHIEHKVVELLERRLAAGATGPLAEVGASVVKLLMTNAKFALAQHAIRIAGPAGVADDGSWGRYAWSAMVGGVFATRIAGGTDEIQRNLIAERGLGLPREPRP